MMKNLCVKISGGLGNQLFQYAFGRAKSLREGVDLVILLTGRREAVSRPFELGNFNIQALVRKESLTDKAHMFVDRLRSPGKRTYVSETTNMFSPDVLETGGAKIYSGNWQSEKYFVDHAEEIRQELTLSNPLSAEAKGILSRVSKEDSVSIHVRRGDYAASAKVATKHGTLGMDYYGKAIAAIKEKVPNPKYFVFSDDIAWTKENLKIPEATFVCSKDGMNLPAHEELALMAACKHNIAANSTFSWWGAWLNANQNKVVIAPKAWYASGIDSTDLVPASWIRI